MYDMVGEENETIKLEIDEIDDTLDNAIKNCRVKFFETFENRCVFDTKLTNIANIETVNSRVFRGFMSFQSEFFGLN